MTPRQIQKFQNEILSHYASHKREMAWRDIADPYRIFVSEMMLQQTQVERVKIKFEEFIAKFPTMQSVAAADKSDVLKVWQGLGYNRRALFIKSACEKVVAVYAGIFPSDFVKLQKLPGIGPSTAGALCAFAYNQPVYFIETNVRAVLLHFFFSDHDKVSDKELLSVLKKVSPICHPQDRVCHSHDKVCHSREGGNPVLDPRLRGGDITTPRDWYYALYDYGTYLKKTLGKKKTALHKKSSHYTKQSKFEGSFRQKRANVLKLKLSDPDISDTNIIKKLKITEEELGEVLASLTKDGMI